MRYLKNIPRRVRVVEVAPRDGLQNEPGTVATADKVTLVERLAAAGFAEVEVSSFVNPSRVPQLADAAEVFAQIVRRPGVHYTALVPNEKGLSRALASGVTSIALFTAASETFTQKNIGRSIAESLAAFRPLVQTAQAAGARVRGYVSTAFICPYEGVIAPERVLPVAAALLEMGVAEVSLGDTIGHAAPDDVARLTECLVPRLPLDRLAYHFHDTRKMALANVLMALQYGVSVFDSSVGGVGGCPFAPGATGNLATETLLHLLDSLDITTGVDREKVLATAEFLRVVLAHSRSAA